MALLRQLIESVQIEPNAAAADGFDVTAYGAIGALLKPQNRAGNARLYRW